MMTARDIYKKDPHTTQTSVRVLAIKSGQRDEVLRCSFKVVDLNDNPVYEALSYVWGTAGKTVKLLVEDVPIFVTPSLAWALRRLAPVTSNAKARGKLRSAL